MMRFLFCIILYNLTGLHHNIYFEYINVGFVAYIGQKLSYICVYDFNVFVKGNYSYWPA